MSIITRDHIQAAIKAAEYDHKTDGRGQFTNAYKIILDEYREALIKHDPAKESRHLSLHWVDLHNHCLILSTKSKSIQP